MLDSRGWIVLLMLAAGCSDERFETSAHLLSSPRKLALSLIAEKHGVDASLIILLSETKTRYPHLDRLLYAYKYCVETCKALHLVLVDENGKEFEEASLDVDEANFVASNGLKLAPSLRAAFDERPDDARLVEVFLRLDADPIGYARWDEPSEVSDEDLRKEREGAFTRQRSETAQRGAILRELTGAQLLSVSLASVEMKVTRKQALDLGRVSFVRDLHLVEEDKPISVPLLFAEATSTGVYAFRNRYQTFGNGMGVIVAEAGLPFGPNFPQGDLGNFVNEQGFGSPITHASESSTSCRVVTPPRPARRAGRLRLAAW